MTTTVERRGSIPAGERRGRAAGPRRSWASAQPFAPPVSPGPVHESWRVVVGQYRLRMVLSDALAVAAAGTVYVGVVAHADAAAVAAVAGVALGLLTLIALCRGYDVRALGDGPGEYQAILRAAGLVSVLLMTFAFVADVSLPRSAVFLGVPAAALLALAGRYVNRKALHRRRTGGEAMMRTLVIGEPSDVDHVVEDLDAAVYHGYRVVGACVPSLDLPGPQGRAPVLGAVADVAQVVVDHEVEVVVVAGSPLAADGLRRLSWALDRAGAKLIVVPQLVEVAAPRIAVRPTAGLSLLEVEVAAPRPRLLAKALLDRFLGVALLLAAAPVIAAAAVAVRVTSPGPAFYRQSRVGVDGERFSMWKLRSMYADAEARRAALVAENEGAGVLFKMKDDPRVTRVGRYLRRYSLDELPQLFNVVRGEMSLVGPRPPLGAEVEQYEDQVHRRLRVKPGLTGLWQVSGRSDLSWEESVRLDLRYVDNWSVVMDMMILWKTLRAVVRPAGAY
ncbi:polyprenyl glycosylphosphotransferase [Actinotalea ferrariae CF5-4]|uniref:Polyprenyl glycosylphosphotransferase n=1 Tax=Actinotalea ferrariae CF5-4 TaxID=948458 RepID=A0A021VNG9_9CELL|nr:sugar transferase [Actinotalea ferrariae]EYR62701.1 polyprenyl glycosylphosphotransferase [Actinotalea ferrariae CF5-4]